MSLRQNGVDIKGVTGLYAKAKERLEATKMWKAEVETWINFSKFFRALVVPLFAIACATSITRVNSWIPGFLKSLGSTRLFGAFREDLLRAGEKLDFLFSGPALPLVIGLLCLLLYVSLRLYHISKMYDLVAKPDEKLAADSVGA